MDQPISPAGFTPAVRAFPTLPQHTDRPMILSRFLKPKWQHADPETRKQAVQGLDSADPTLLDLARQDTDPAVRRAALERIGDLDLLQHSAAADTDPAVREAAATRYRALMAGTAAGAPALAARLDRLRRAPDTALMAYLLQHAAEAELRAEALQIVTTEAALAEIAVNNAHADVRLAALERVQDPELLEQVARNSRNRDKRVHRQARERLDNLVAEQARAAHLERLCADMEALRWDGESGHNAGHFPKLEQEWRALEDRAPQALRDRYAQARERFLVERQASAGRRAQRLDLIEALEALLEQLRQARESDATLDATIRAHVDPAPAAWQALGVPQDSEGRRLETRFQSCLQDIHEQERHLQRNQSRAGRLRAVLEQADNLLQQASEVREADLKTLRQRWDGLERPENATLISELQSRFDGLLDKLRARLQRQVQQRDQEWHELQELTSQLELIAGEGELQQATALYEQARQRLKHNIGLSRAQMAAIEERLQACSMRLGELRDWRRWGTHQAREQLCATAEQLVGLEADPADIAQRIQQAREAWKALDHQEGAAPKALWKRFNGACERAYAPCQAYFENQARERQQHLAQKIALCEQLEQFVAATDWRQPDWREADRLRRRAQEHWHKLGPVNRAERKPLDRRFQQVLKTLDTHLGAERNRELQRRQQLIEQVEAQIESPDLRTAIDIAKRAQAEWHPSVQASPKQEQALWKAFRAACDAVFARRQAEQQAADAERQGNLVRKEALCAELEALNSSDPAQLPAVRSRLRAIQEEWDTLGPVPKAEQRALGQRFENALQQFSRHEHALRQRDAQETFTQLQNRARLCARMEALLEAPEAVDATLLAELQQEWAALPALSTALLTPLQQRFTAAEQALSDPNIGCALHGTLSGNLARKRVWCVCMEIVAGVDSPPEYAALRMEYQVARLSASLAGARVQGDALYDARQLQEQWFRCGALPAAEATALDSRFLRAAQAWWQRENT